MKSRESNMPVHGSVIQRSLIPEGLGAVLNIATVPISEIDGKSIHMKDHNAFHHLVGQILGIPSESILDDNQYAQLAVRLKDGRFWKDLAMQADHPYIHDLFHYSYRYWRDYWEVNNEDMKRVAFPESPAGLLGLHSLSLMVSPTRNSQNRWPFFFPPVPYRRKGRSELFSELDLSEESLQLAMDCFFTALEADDRVLRFTRAAGNYDIPSGQSPRAQSDSLTKIIETSKKVCLAPIAFGGAAAVTQLGQGNYVAALLSTATGSAMTLILVGTVSVADYLVHYLLHKRNSLDE